MATPLTSTYGPLGVLRPLATDAALRGVSERTATIRSLRSFEGANGDLPLSGAITLRAQRSAQHRLALSTEQHIGSPMRARRMSASIHARRFQA